MEFPPICLGRRALTLKAVTNSHREVSPYSFKQTPYDFLGGMWTASLDLHSMSSRNRATFLRWLVSLDGPKGAFKLLALDYDGPFGRVANNPVISSSALARGKTVAVAHTGNDHTTVDDQLTIGGHLHIVTGVSEKVDGIQVISIWPRLRADVSPSDHVEALAPYGVWSLANSENGYGLANGLSMSATLELIEAI